MEKRKSVRMTVLEKSVFGSFSSAEYSHDSVVDVIAWLQSCLAATPAEYRSSLRLSVDSVGEYEGDHHTALEIYYSRPETDEEMQTRKMLEAISDAEADSRERRQYEALKRKFENHQ